MDTYQVWSDFRGQNKPPFDIFAQVIRTTDYPLLFPIINRCFSNYKFIFHSFD